VGSLASGKAAPAFVNLLYLPMIYLSGIFFPLPKSMYWFAAISPAYHLDQLAFASVGAANDGSVWLHVLALAGVTLVCTMLALRRLARVG
jgi:ABC-2 type transport system permease protein